MSLHAKLIAVALLIAGATGYLAYLGAASNWRYYVLVDECLANRDSLAGYRLRVSGRVAPQTLSIRSDRSQARFTLCGNSGQIDVTCPGPLPDNLNEDMEVVVEGTLQLVDGIHLQGDRVLTRCASKYETQDATARPADSPLPKTPTTSPEGSRDANSG